MKKEKEKDTIAINNKLRQMAELLLNKKEKGAALSFSEFDSLRLLHKLEVYQIELEMQNDELRRAKEKAELAEKKYTELYDFSPSGYLSISKKGEIIDLNLSTECMLGKKRPSLINSSFGFFVSADTRAIYINFLSNIFTTDLKQTCEIKLVSADDSIRDILAEGIISNLGEKCLVTLTDISKRKLAEQILLESEEKFRMVFENAFDGISIFSDDHDSSQRRLVECNEQYAEMSGRSREDLLQLGSIVELQSRDEDKANNDLMDSMENGKEYSGLYSWIRPDGRGNVIEYVGKPVVWKGKSYTIGIDRDITQRKQIEKELIKAKLKAEESDRLKSAFLANMSHEIRTPMNGILGFTELLKDLKLTGKKQQEFIGIIQKSGTRMLNIINDIINISKIDSQQIEISITETDINEQVEYIYHFFRLEGEQKKLQLSFKNGLSSRKALVHADREKLYAVLTNLVKNAIKFTKTGSIEFGYELKGKFLEFYVKDTGPGIPDELKEIIFERFRQGNESSSWNFEGSGLGLAISKAYVEMLGGRIWVDSALGQGSTFRFSMPYLNGIKKNVPLQTIAKEEIIMTKKLKILVVDDDETSQILFNVMISPFASEYFQASNGHEAVKVCRQNPGINLVLMDINMPGMNGYEATRLIREFNKDVVIIAQTAYALPEDREKSIEAGCTNYISKPINRAMLTGLINQYIS